MAIQSRRGYKVNFDKDKMLPGEFGVALDSQEAFICFGAGITKKMATDEDYADMIEESVTATENAKQATVNANKAIDDFRELEISKMAINDGVRSTASGWSSSKTGAELDTTNAKVYTLNTSLANQIGSASGSSINLPNSYNGGLFLKELQGKSVQNGTPTPEAPVSIVSVGEDGSVVARVTGKNVLPSGAVKTLTNSGITAIVNADGTIISNGTSTWGDINNWILGNYRVNPTVANTIVTLYPGNTYYVKDVELFTYENGVDGRIYPGKITILASQYPNGFRVTGVRHVTVAVGTILTNKVYYPQIELGSTSTTYEQYKEQLITIPLTQPLRSVGSVCDRIYKKSGIWRIERKFGVEVFDGSSDEGWATETTATTETDGAYRMKCTKIANLVKRASDIAEIPNLLCNRYIAKSPGDTYSKNQCITISTTGNTIVYDSSFATNNISLYTTWLKANPVTVIYELATPTFEPFSQDIQDKLNKLQSYQGVTNVFTTDPQQPVIVVSYGKTDSSALALYAENVSDNKLDKSKSVNNLITTVEGTVLDGRQGKALNEKIGNLSDLKTTSKTDLVSSVNEVKASVDGVNNNLELLSKINKSSNIANPTNSGHSTLLDYITKVLVPSGLGYYSFHSNGFSDLPTTDWGYTCEYLNSGGAVFVRAYKHLSASEMCVRSLTTSNTWTSNWKYLSFT